MDFRLCDHPTFQARTAVMRLTSVEGGPVTGYSADIRIRCSKCGLPFRFKGLPTGSSPDQPMASFLGDELRAPIEPAPDADAWEEPTKPAPAA